MLFLNRSFYNAATPSLKKYKMNNMNKIRKVRYSYLPQQFYDPNLIFKEMEKTVRRGDFTLGQAVEEFENKFQNLLGVKHAIGVNSGTDALKVGLNALGVGYGDEVITVANTFVSTVGAINEVGATPVLVDCDENFCINVNDIEKAITSKTKALFPVHLTGAMPDMNKIKEIANHHNLKIIEDACQSILASFDGINAGNWGDIAGFSMHPLKNLNVWGDGGVVVTNNDELAQKVRLLRNNGIRNRDEVEILGYNTRLDTIQAVVGNWLMPNAKEASNQRIENAAFYDAALKDIPQISVPHRPDNLRQVYHIYQVCAEDRDQCVEYCNERGVEIKVHYPIPLYRQKALAFLGHKLGDYPMAERHSQEVMSLPVDQYISREEQSLTIETIKDFYTNQ